MFSPDCRWSWADYLPYGEGFQRVLTVWTNDRKTPELVTVSIAPVRDAESVGAGANEVDAEAEIEWGSGQAIPLKSVLDVGRGITFTLAAIDLRVSLRNVGGGQQEGSPPPRRFQIHAAPGGNPRVLPPRRRIRIGALLAGATSAEQLVPEFSAHLAVPRFVPAAVRVQFRNGGGVPMAEYTIPREVEGRIQVPVGADRFVVINEDAMNIALVQAQFDLAI